MRTERGDISTQAQSMVATMTYSKHQMGLRKDGTPDMRTTMARALAASQPAQISHAALKALLLSKSTDLEGELRRLLFPERQEGNDSPRDCCLSSREPAIGETVRARYGAESSWNEAIVVKREPNGLVVRFEGYDDTVLVPAGRYRRFADSILRGAGGPSARETNGSRCREAADSDQARGDVYIFVDNSNTWTEGKKTLAEQKGLDSKEDCRFRLSADRMYELLASSDRGSRTVQIAKLYGSFQANDEMQYGDGWGKYFKAGFDVERHKRSQWTQKEKLVDQSMVADISVLSVLLQSEGLAEQSTIVIASGDSDLIPAIRKALDRKIKVEVWAWSRCTSHLFRELHDKEDSLLTLVELDRFIEHVGFVDTHFNMTRWRIDDFALSTVVVVGIEEDEVAATCNQCAGLSSEWWTACIESGGEHGVALIFRANASSVAKQLSCVHDAFGPQLETGEVRILPYSEFVPCVSPSDHRCSTSSAGSGDEAIVHRSHGYEDARQRGSCSMSSSERSFSSSPRASAPRFTDRGSEQLVACHHGFRCLKGTACSFHHTDDEQKFFALHGGACPRPYKLKPCAFYHAKSCAHMHSPSFCLYAHGEADTFCLKCKCSGHSTNLCRKH
jgi:hypothetical protein